MSSGKVLPISGFLSQSEKVTRVFEGSNRWLLDEGAKGRRGQHHFRRSEAEAKASNVASRAARNRDLYPNCHIV